MKIDKLTLFMRAKDKHTFCLNKIYFLDILTYQDEEHSMLRTIEHKDNEKMMFYTAST